MKKDKIIIGSRASKLAMIQSNWTKSTLESTFPDVEVVIKNISTKGDRITDAPLSRLGGVGLFTKELENALLSNEIDLAVHSAKDMPAELPDGLTLGAITKREDPSDVLISKNNVRLDQLPDKAVIGTSSLRRQAQLKAKLPGIVISDLRGNLDTRVKKIQNGEFDGIIVANAGLIRMGYDDVERQVIPYDYMLPAVGQGALAIEIRQGDERIAPMILTLNHAETNSGVSAERALLGKLHGGCQTPIGASGKVDGDKLRLTAMASSLDGTRMIRDEIEGAVEDAEKLGIELAERILSNGGDKILQEIRDSLANQTI